MTSYEDSGFEIMITNDDDGIRNHFVIDRTIFVNTLLPPPPKHFVYGKIDRKKLRFYRFLVDKNDPPPPASLLRLSKMSVKKLKIRPTNQIKYYCWWKGLPIAGNYERSLFLSEPNSFVMFEREMSMRFDEMILMLEN